MNSTREGIRSSLYSIYLTTKEMLCVLSVLSVRSLGSLRALCIRVRVRVEPIPGIITAGSESRNIDSCTKVVRANNTWTAGNPTYKYHEARKNEAISEQFTVMQT